MLTWKEWFFGVGSVTTILACAIYFGLENFADGEYPRPDWKLEVRQFHTDVRRSMLQRDAVLEDLKEFKAEGERYTLARGEALEREVKALRLALEVMKEP